MNKLTQCLLNESKTGKDMGLLVLRLAFGLVLIYGHGFEKLTTIFSGQEIQFMDPFGIGAKTSFYLAGFAEGICAIFLIIGLFGRIPALILTINFLAVFIFHAFIAADGFPVLELRFFNLWGFRALALTGPGKYSIDYLFLKRNG